MFQQRIYSVHEVTSHIRSVLEADTRLANVWIKGEISNFKLHTSGHLYFTLKDSMAAMKCVMFKSRSGKLQFRPEDGMEVVAKGYVSVYDKTGQYQLYVEEMDPSGLGGLYMAFEQLKAKLQGEGLFDPQRKKSLPLMPSAVAVITSPTGAAVRDVFHVLNRRFPGLRILFVPALVQGTEAPGSIANAVRLVNRHGTAELILLVRGGGSIEGLWAFNTEEVARAVADSQIPVISGVGHETDYTIVDFVADKRGPTPSAAAEVAVPDKRELLRHLELLDSRIHTLVDRHVKERKKQLEKLFAARVFQKPDTIMAQHYLCLDYLERQLATGITSTAGSFRSRFEGVAGKLDALSPLRILSRGYAICRKDHQVIRDAGAVETGDTVEVVLRKGSLLCQVNARRGNLAWKK